MLYRANSRHVYSFLLLQVPDAGIVDDLDRWLGTVVLLPFVMHACLKAFKESFSLFGISFCRGAYPLLCIKDDGDVVLPLKHAHL